MKTILEQFRIDGKHGHPRIHNHTEGPMNEDELVARHPRLWHMSEPEAWPGMLEHGLLSAKALCGLHGLDGERTQKLLERRRPEGVMLRGEGRPTALLRDQKPMRDEALERCLEGGMTPSQWYATLNARVFLWPDLDRLLVLMGARAYRGRAHLVVTFDTASLVDSYRDAITLSPINSGATLYVPQRRGPDTFLPIGRYPYEERRKAGKRPFAEFTVMGGIGDVARHALAADIHEGGATIPLWRRGGA